MPDTPPTSAAVCGPCSVNDHMACLGCRCSYCADLREPDTAALTLADLSNMPLRIEIESACQYVEEQNNLRMVSCARIYELPEGGSRKKPKLLLGPVGVPDNPDASWSELLRCLADALEQDGEIVEANGA